jgi:hypothetical protein
MASVAQHHAAPLCDPSRPAAGLQRLLRPVLPLKPPPLLPPMSLSAGSAVAELRRATRQAQEAQRQKSWRLSLWMMLRRDPTLRRASLAAEARPAVPLRARHQAKAPGAHPKSLAQRAPRRPSQLRANRPPPRHPRLAAAQVHSQRGCSPDRRASEQARGKLRVLSRLHGSCSRACHPKTPSLSAATKSQRVQYETCGMMDIAVLTVPADLVLLVASRGRSSVPILMRGQWPRLPASLTVIACAGSHRRQCRCTAAQCGCPIGCH